MKKIIIKAVTISLASTLFAGAGNINDPYGSNGPYGRVENGVQSQQRAQTHGEHREADSFSSVKLRALENIINRQARLEKTKACVLLARSRAAIRSCVDRGRVRY